MQTPGVILIKWVTIALPSYIVLYYLVTFIWRALKSNDQPREISCTIQTIIFVIAFVIGIIVVRMYQ